MPKYSISRSPSLMIAVSEIKGYMLRNSISQSKLAELSGVPQPQVHKILSGKTKKPSLHLKDLCDYANITFPPLISDPEADYRIAEAIKKVWDGRDETIDLIVRLIECAAHVNGGIRR